MKQLAFKVIITDRNPDQDGLVDVHQCAYLPSIYDDNQKALVSTSSFENFVFQNDDI